MNIDSILLASQRKLAALNNYVGDYILAITIQSLIHITTLVQVE